MQVEGFPERTLSELGVEGPTAGFSRPPGGVGRMAEARAETSERDGENRIWGLL